MWSALSNASEKAPVIRAPKCLSGLAIRRSSVTLAGAIGAVGGQEAGAEGVGLVRRERLSHGRK